MAKRSGGVIIIILDKRCFIRLLEFKNIIEDNPRYDVYFINPFPELVTLYDSIWE